MHLPQIKIPATYYRGGTSKGIFFNLADLPEAAQKPGKIRDAILLRVLGSPDPYGKQIDGMGNGSSSTSKAVILSKSNQQGYDVDYLFGQVSVDKPFIDWSGNCGNLTAAVGAFAIKAGFIDPDKIPFNEYCTVKIWQVNIQKAIIAHIPIVNKQVQETGDFVLDGVTFPAAEVQLEFLDPADKGGIGEAMFPTGNLVDDLVVPGIGILKATMINAGIATIFINAEAIGCTGIEQQEDINSSPHLLAMFETIRAYGAVRMGLINNISEALTRQHTPKLVFIAPAQRYVTSSGKEVCASEIDLVVRALSMGKLHHAMMGTAAVAIATAAAIPGTLVNLAAGGNKREQVCFGHPSGTLRAGAKIRQENGQWIVEKVIMSRSTRILMDGWVYVPGDVLRAND